MGLRVALEQVVGVVRRDERVVELARQLDEALVDDLFFRHPVAHDLDVEPVAEDVAEHLRVLLRRRVVVLEQRRRDHRGHAAGEDDQPFVMLRQQIHVDPRLVVVALEETGRDQRREISIAGVARGEQGDVRFIAHGAVESAARGDVGLAPDDRDEPLRLRRVVELDRAEHHPVVRERDAGRSVGVRLLAQRVDAARAVQQRVLAVDMQMDERTQRKANLRGKRKRGKFHRRLRSVWLLCERRTHLPVRKFPFPCRRPRKWRRCAAGSPSSRPSATSTRT